MKKRVFSFICMFAVMLFYVSALPCAADEGLIELSQDHPFQMTVLGDSIAAGYGLEGYDSDSEPCYECASYANILAEKYGLVPDSTYYNYAASGATSADLVRTLGDSNVMRNLKNSDTILISIGGNDLLAVLWNALETDEWSMVENTDGSGFNIDIAKLMQTLSTIDEDIDSALANFESNFDTVIETIRANNSDALVIVNTLYDPFAGSEQLAAFTSVSGSALERFNAIIYDNSTDPSGHTRYIVSDVAEDFSGKEAELTNINSFDIHPSAAGHAEIADLLDSEITSHTFTIWVIDTSAGSGSQATAEEKEEAKNFASVMFGFFLMLIIMITVLFLHSLRKLKDQ